MRYDSTMANALNEGIRDDLTLLIERLGFSLPTVDLKHQCDDQMRDLAGAQSQEELAVRFERVGRWAAGLYEKEEVSPQAYRDLQEACGWVHSQARARIEVRP